MTDRRREFSWVPFAAAAGVAVLAVVLSAVLGNNSGTRGAATARAAATEFVQAYRTHDKSVLSRLTCPDRPNGAGLTIDKHATVRVTLDADQRHATVHGGTTPIRLRIEKVGGRYFACRA